MSRQEEDIIEVSIWYGDAEIRLAMEWEPGYLIRRAVYRRGGEEIELGDFHSLLRDERPEARNTLVAHVVWLLHNFNREMSLVKKEGMNLCDKITIWIDMLEEAKSKTLLAVSISPHRTDIIVNDLEPFIKGLYEIVDYLYQTVARHCKRISKFLKGLNHYKKHPRGREIVYDVYSSWITSDLRKKSLEEYEDYGLEKVNRSLLKIANPFIKKRLMEINADPFAKVNFLAAVNLRICDDVNLYISVLNTSLNLLEYIRDNVARARDMTAADIEHIYEKLSDVGDDLYKLVVNIRSLYMNLEPL